jgi:two-component sensor histidine kinase
MAHTSNQIDQAVFDGVLDACSSLLTPHTGMDTAINNALHTIGSAADVDRAYIFQVRRDKDGTDRAYHRYEWTAPGIAPEIENPALQGIPLVEAGYGRWLASFRQFRPVFGSIASFPPEEHATLEAQSILSLVVLPIHINSSLWGFVGFDECTNHREWDESSIDLLIAISLALGIALDTENKPDDFDGSVKTYLRLVEQFFKTDSLLFSESTIGTLRERAHARLRVLSRSYTYLVHSGRTSSLILSDYIDALKPLFDDISGNVQVDFDVEGLRVPRDRGLDLAIVIAEILGAADSNNDSELARAILLTTIRSKENRVEMTVTARSADGTPAGDASRLDAPAIGLLRNIRERFDATISPTAIDGLLFRLSFSL